MGIEHRTVERGSKSRAGGKTAKTKAAARGALARIAERNHVSFEVPVAGSELVFLDISYGLRRGTTTLTSGGGPSEAVVVVPQADLLIGEGQNRLVVVELKAEQAQTDLSEREWEQAKAAALDIVAASLDTPEDFLAYIRAHIGHI